MLIIMKTDKQEKECYPSALKYAIPHTAQRTVQREIHSGEAGQTADKLGNSLRRKHAGGAHPHRQDECEGSIDNGLTQQGKEHRFWFFFCLARYRPISYGIGRFSFIVCSGIYALYIPCPCLFHIRPE